MLNILTYHDSFLVSWLDKHWAQEWIDQTWCWTLSKTVGQTQRLVWNLILNGMKHLKAWVKEREVKAMHSSLRINTIQQRQQRWEEQMRRHTLTKIHWSFDLNFICRFVFTNTWPEWYRDMRQTATRQVGAWCLSTYEAERITIVPLVFSYKL